MEILASSLVGIIVAYGGSLGVRRGNCIKGRRGGKNGYREIKQKVNKSWKKLIGSSSSGQVLRNQVAQFERMRKNQRRILLTIEITPIGRTSRVCLPPFAWNSSKTCSLSV